MPSILSLFALPTLKDLMERSRQAFRANLKGSDAWVWPNNVYVSAKVIAGQVFEVFGFAAYIQKQMFAWSAPDIESLTNHGIEFGIPQKPAAPANGNVIFTASADLEVLTGAVLRRADGAQFNVAAGGILPTSGTLTVPVVSDTDGKLYNTEANTPLEIVSGVTSSSDTPPTCAVDSGGIALGEDIEDIESYRARILFRKRNPPHGGSAADYVMWAGQVAGVSFNQDRPTVFVERLWAGPGTVRVFPLMFDLYADGVPQPADIQRVSDFIEVVKPAGAKVTVAAAARVPVDVVISGLKPFTSDVQNAVVAELADTFRRLGRVAGIDTYFGSMPYLASPTSFSRSWIWQSVANASGEERHSIVTPAADIDLAPGQLPVLGNVMFID